MTKRKNIIRMTIFILLAGVLIYYFYPESKLPDDTQIDTINRQRN